MGRVYRVEDTKINEEVALKIIKPEISSDKKTIERFHNELKITRKIRHKNVSGMFDLGEDQGTHFITMEYVPGQDLKRLIRQTGRLAIPTVISITEQICEGLAEAHRLGVIHRDLKPSNVIIDKVGSARIMDFGIARSLKAKGITGAGVMVGTPEYMSPEQVEGRDLDQRSDLYSLGIILYEMVTGQPPFAGDTPLSIAVKHKTESPPDPKDLNAQIPEDLSLLIMKCLEKDREKRYQSASELSSELKKIEKGFPISDSAIPQKKSTTSKEITVTFKKRWVLITSPFVILLVAALAYFFTRIGKEAPLSENQKIVVLPFKNLGLAEDEYLAGGIADEIRNRLSVLRKLDVISRPSSIQYRKMEMTAKQIREDSNVDYVLEGTVRWDKKSGEKERVRIMPELIKASEDTQLWAKTYDGSIEDMFKVQTDIAKQVIEAIDIVIKDPDRRALECQASH
jgi:serine/threonine protein kinase